MSCRKISFASIKDAKVEIHRMNHSPKHIKENLGSKSRPYKCPICGSFHLTTMSKSENRRLRKQRREKRRRLDIMSEIRKSRSISKVIELQEHWMTLTLKNKTCILECNIFGKIFSIPNLGDTHT